MIPDPEIDRETCLPSSCQTCCTKHSIEKVGSKQVAEPETAQQNMKAEGRVSVSAPDAHAREKVQAVNAPAESIPPRRCPPAYDRQVEGGEILKRMEKAFRHRPRHASVQRQI